MTFSRYEDPTRDLFRSTSFKYSFSSEQGVGPYVDLAEPLSQGTGIGVTFEFCQHVQEPLGLLGIMGVGVFDGQKREKKGKKGSG